MDINEFREFGRAAIDFLVDYFETIRDRFSVGMLPLGNLVKIYLHSQTSAAFGATRIFARAFANGNASRVSELEGHHG